VVVIVCKQGAGSFLLLFIFIAFSLSLFSLEAAEVYARGLFFFIAFFFIPDGAGKGWLEEATQGDYFSLLVFIFILFFHPRRG